MYKIISIYNQYSFILYILIIILLLNYFFIYKPDKNKIINAIKEKLSNELTDINYINHIFINFKKFAFFNYLIGKNHIYINIYIDKKLYIINKLQNKNDMEYLNSIIKIIFNYSKHYNSDREYSKMIKINNNNFIIKNKKFFDSDVYIHHFKYIYIN